MAIDVTHDVARTWDLEADEADEVIDTDIRCFLVLDAGE